jgi:hypothetical protein
MPDSLPEELERLTEAIERLGNNRASTNMGGMEALGKVIEEASVRIADALAGVADRLADLRESLDDDKAR